MCAFFIMQKTGTSRRQRCLIIKRVAIYRLSLIITYENKSIYFNKRTLSLKSLNNKNSLSCEREAFL